ATCDVLAFTPDGKHLLAVGDDKVVRIWKVSERRLDPEPTLRWAIWREQRGQIYALAISPDQEHRYVAIAGLGLFTGTAVVLDRVKGQVMHALTDMKNPPSAIRALAFSPSGKQLAFGPTDGSIWVWNLNRDKPNDTRQLGKVAGKGQFNRVRLLA